MIVIFAGTTEGRELSDWLSKRGIRHAVCVATEYGERIMQDSGAGLVSCLNRFWVSRI